MLLVVTFGVSGEIQGHTHFSAFIIVSYVSKQMKTQLKFLLVSRGKN